MTDNDSFPYVCKLHFFRRFKSAGSAAREKFFFQIFFIHQDHERLLQLQHCHVCSMSTVTASWLIGDEWKSFDYFRLFSVFARIRMVAKGTAVKCFLCHASVPYNSNDRQVQPDLMIHKHSTNRYLFPTPQKPTAKASGGAARSLLWPRVLSRWVKNKTCHCNLELCLYLVTVMA